ncbi:MAG: 2-succinylbenzoate--CoA ligase [Oscillatoriaceae bacterium SKW80]|nr:2-succinylbenzoate--CoA ligase [Oscillatoriaceae bacterium SKYG93]MCX8119905.1 2-succinylbenzoate--CoA ligase [Oscillatoriaceae bacterium SKW80]MDW8451838.1 2-succinylbenzoate--CoA ligase [Oscillatoriaceae cyanobacterium SKYGB_i_bin93]HIK27570.1 2-succinylbenzoate--CoA ligase [Oscillatoriaceae cyanobacterium M7585_C2015_266]
MPNLLNYLQNRALEEDNWQELNALASQLYEQLYEKINPLFNPKNPPKILLAEKEPLRFLASLVAATAAGCSVFCCNPNWVKQEWQKVFDLVQPDLILGDLSNLSNLTNVEVKFYNKPLTELRPSIMIPTGGSSGKIRFAVHTWETLTASVKGLQEYFQVSEINSFCVLPVYHVSGLMQFWRALITGGRLVIFPFKVLESGDKPEINPSEFFISLVPTQLQRLLQNLETAHWLSQFQTVFLGGAPAWAELLETARHYRIRLAPTYGMTETASQIATLKPDDFLAGNNSCGKVLPHAKITIRAESGEVLMANQTGIITVEADSLALGYYGEGNVGINLGKIYQTDDLGYFDEQGYLNIVGRGSDKIITGGENVFPAEVEAAILATGLVADVCVLGISDRNWGEVVTAVYIPRNSEVSTATLKTALEEKLSKFKQPKYWVAVESLPRNSQGKVNREWLQEIAISWQKTQAASPLDSSWGHS